MLTFLDPHFDFKIKFRMKRLMQLPAAQRFVTNYRTLKRYTGNHKEPILEPRKRNFKIWHWNPNEDQKKVIILFANRIAAHGKFLD